MTTIMYRFLLKFMSEKKKEIDTINNEIDNNNMFI